MRNLELVNALSRVIENVDVWIERDKKKLEKGGTNPKNVWDSILEARVLTEDRKLLNCLEGLAHAVAPVPKMRRGTWSDITTLAWPIRMWVQRESSWGAYESASTRAKPKLLSEDPGLQAILSKKVKYKDQIAPERIKILWQFVLKVTDRTDARFLAREIEQLARRHPVFSKGGPLHTQNSGAMRSVKRFLKLACREDVGVLQSDATGRKGKRVVYWVASSFVRTKPKG